MSSWADSQGPAIPRSFPVFLASPFKPYKPFLTKVDRSGSVLATCNTMTLPCYITSFSSFPHWKETSRNFLFLWVTSSFSSFTSSDIYPLFSSMAFNYLWKIIEHLKFTRNCPLQYWGGGGGQRRRGEHSTYSHWRTRLGANKKTSCLIVTPTCNQTWSVDVQDYPVQFQSFFIFHNSRSKRKLHFTGINSWLPGFCFTPAA